MLSTIAFAMLGSTVFSALMLAQLRDVAAPATKRAFAVQHELDVPLAFDRALFRSIARRHTATTLVASAALAALLAALLDTVLADGTIAPLAACVFGGAPGLAAAWGQPGRVLQATLLATCAAQGLSLRPMTDEQRARLSGGV